MPDLPQMAPPLQAILLSELSRGNSILSVGDWPPDCRLFVMLARPFRKKYVMTTDVEYAVVNDPHYWKAEYLYRNGLECLACGF
ncbi:hypothetical protein EDC40_102166 [Aminobacter aminovorans]|uniref:Uncharacterized protein n=1 Tax=Aminobacter aminovorans TaxID=83263 RepID=A0A380WHW4_AMIAI|nr:hypothetical protein [Aminobacter aminovorans]TCS28729.1 hypothetical protein EDC40_102166 [Aminobacter aminovorans]SUU88583.1 Uncharacterised protein [Aminobacter aminovorans]